MSFFLCGYCVLICVFLGDYEVWSVWGIISDFQCFFKWWLCYVLIFLGVYEVYAKWIFNFLMFCFLSGYCVVIYSISVWSYAFCLGCFHLPLLALCWTEFSNLKLFLSIMIVYYVFLLPCFCDLQLLLLLFSLNVCNHDRNAKTLSLFRE